MFKFLKDSWQDANKRVEEENRARAITAQAKAAGRHALPDMSAIAREFAASVSKQGVTLDFTAASLPLVDRLLAGARKDLASLSAADRKKPESFAALKMGAYVGEVLRRHAGGAWSAGEDGLPVLDLGGIVAPVVGAVMSLLLHGRVDMPAGPVESVQTYVGTVSRASLAWLESVVRGRADSLESLQREMSDESDLAAWLINETGRAVTIARVKWNLALDFTPKSLDAVEQVLGQLHELRKNAPANDRPTDEQTEATALVWGVYVGEVMRRQYGGKWAISQPEGVLQLDIDGSRVFPARNVQKRLVDGPADAIPFYFKSIGGVLAAKPR